MFALAFLCAVLSLHASPAQAGYAHFVMDANTGKVLDSQNADTKNYPASLTKMMTLYLVFEALHDGRLIRVLPGWRGVQGIVHLVFTTRRGLPPAVRALIDHLATGFPAEVVTR
jgi:hypothetical protein